MRKHAALLLSLGLFVGLCGCATQGLTPLQQSKLQAQAYSNLYLSLYNTVLQLNQSPDIDPRVKQVLRTKVNPAMNALKELVLAYDKAVADAVAGDQEAIWQASLYKVRIEKLLEGLLPLINQLKGVL